MTSGTSFSPPPAFGRFRLLHQIGAGVLGPVFRTHDPDGDRLVAVKAFALDITPERAQELVDELQRVVDIDLEHPHIARPLAAGVEESVAFLAQEYVAGESLDAAIRQYGPAPASDAVRLISHVAEALDVAARVGVFHGVLHPRDVLVTPGETHVTGLGVSMALERIGQHGPIRRPYAAPEREAGLEWGAAADVFSLAVIAYEVLTGRRALPGTEQPLPGLADLRAKDAAALRDVFERAIDAEPERRPTTAREFAEAFGAALVEPGAGAEKAERPSRRKARIRVPKLPGLEDPGVPEAMPEPAPVEMPAAVVVDAPAAEAPVAAVESAAAVESIVKAEPVVAVEPVPVPLAAEQPETVQETAVDSTPEPAPPVVPVAAAEPEIVRPRSAQASTPLPVEESAAEPVSKVEPEPVAEPVPVPEPKPEFEPEPEPVDVPLELKLRPTPQPSELRMTSLFDAPVEEAAAAPPVQTSRPELAVAETDDEREGVTVAGAAYPVADRAEDVRASRYDAAAPSRPVRQWGMLAVGVAAGLLIGLMGGYEIGTRRGTPVPAAAVTAPVSEAPKPAMSVVGPAQGMPPAQVSASPESDAKSAAKVTEFVPAPVQQPPIVATETRPLTPAPAPEKPAPVPATDKPAPAPAAEKPAKAPAPSAAPVKAAGRAADAKPAAPAAAKKTAQAPATLSFATKPAGARVLVDGKELGKTPFTWNKVSPGAHTIEFRLTGFRPWSTSVTVGAGKTQRVTASLERTTSR